MAKLKTIIGFIEDKIDEIIKDLNHNEYDGCSQYYYYTSLEVPNRISSIRSVVLMLSEAGVLSKPQTEYWIEKINEIKH